MTKLMKFKLKLAFLVLARVKGKTSQLILLTWRRILNIKRALRLACAFRPMKTIFIQDNFLLSHISVVSFGRYKAASAPEMRGITRKTIYCWNGATMIKFTIVLIFHLGS